MHWPMKLQAVRNARHPVDPHSIHQRCRFCPEVYLTDPTGPGARQRLGVSDGEGEPELVAVLMLSGDFGLVSTCFAYFEILRATV